MNVFKVEERFRLEVRGKLIVQSVVCTEIGCQRNYGYPIPVQGWVGWSPRHPGLVDGSPAYSMGFELLGF